MKHYYAIRDNDEVVSSADLTEYSVGKNGWVITRIETHPAKLFRGYGTQLLQQISADADSEGATIWIEPIPISHNALNTNELTDWYLKRGFSYHGNWLIRRPRGTTGLEIVINNAKKDPNYCPYCMRCTGLIRMKKVAPFYWNCHCGAIYDLRDIVNSSPGGGAAADGGEGCSPPKEIT